MSHTGSDRLTTWTEHMPKRGWASLMTGTKTIVAHMQPWRHESMFAGHIIEQGLTAPQAFPNATGYPVTQESRREQQATLQHIAHSLQRIRSYLAGIEQGLLWIDRLRDYIERLRTSNPAQTSEEQFGQLYTLRKWLFWVPVYLVQSQGRDVHVLLVLAYFYATALALEPMYPEIGSAFCANMAFPPLEEILRIVSTMQSTSSFSQDLQGIALIMEIPREMATRFRSRLEWNRQQVETEQRQSAQNSPCGLQTLDLDFEAFDYSNVGSLSPAFAPSPQGFGPSPVVTAPRSPFLEVPKPQMGMEDYEIHTGGSAYGTPARSPSFPAQRYSMHEDTVYGYGMGAPLCGYPGGFVAATPILWAQ
ncbi:hypothetical protein LTR39_003780 [Cryomyces antarcticus]|nr:hypothetical protein LTR39_003780 [Cryomyces antarcticus]